MPLPGWDSLERTSAYANVFLYAGWIALGSLVVFEIFNHVYSVHRDALIAAQEGPRHLTDASRSLLLDALRRAPTGTIEISCAGPDAEPCRFATDLRDVLAEAGWTIERFNEGTIFGGPIVSGVFLEVQNAVVPPTRATVLMLALRTVGVEAPMRTGNPAWDADTVIMTVGVKPLTP